MKIGIINRTITARNRTTLAGMVEELNFAYTDVYTGKAQTGEINAQVSLNEVYSKLSTEMKSHIYTLDGTSTISLVDSKQSSITLLNDAEAIGSTGTAGQNTISVEIHEERESTSYYLESDGIYYPMCIRNFKVELDEENASTTQPTGAGSLGSGIEISFIDEGETEEKSESNYITASKNGTTITLTAKSNTNGSTQVVVRDGDVTLTGNIEVTVNPTYTISLGTMTNGSVSITTNNVDTPSNAKYGSGVEIKLTATGATNPKKYEFEKWSDDNSKTNPRKITVNATTSAVTYTATFVESKLYGAQVKLNGGNDITVGNGTIKDNWKLFYIDNDDNDNSTAEYVHLIYGDYYPVDVQTDPDTGSTNTINLAPNSSYPWGVNAASNRLQLLRYLKNNSSYAEANLDSITPSGNYTSWTNLATALTTGTGKALKDKTILVQGAPNITMWVDSWNEQGYTKLALKDSGNPVTGYYIGIKTTEANQTYSNSLVLNNDNGYNDKLYFPYKAGITGVENSDKSSSYWLASPGGGNDTQNVCYVFMSKGGVSCGYDWGNNSTGASYAATRPVISILKSDFQELFPNISIEK